MSLCVTGGRTDADLINYSIRYVSIFIFIYTYEQHIFAFACTQIDIFYNDVKTLVKNNCALQGIQ